MICLAICGVFFVQPEVAPARVTIVVQLFLEGTLGLALDATSGWPWLILAMLTFGISFPVLTAVELGATLANQAAQMKALPKELRQAAWT